MTDTVAGPCDKRFLFHPEPLIHEEARLSPLIVVGLPRSGTTLLSHLVSLLDEWFVFDDLYLYRQAAAAGATGPLRDDQLRRLIEFLAWQVRARIKHETEYLPLRLSWADVDQMATSVLTALRSRETYWWDLLEEWLLRLARYHGKQRWGYKAPQDFMHMGPLAKAYPGVRFLLLIRDPVDVLASFKHLRGKDGHPGQYHPLVYARYWRLAAEQVPVEARRLDVPLHTVRYEDLVEEPQRQLSAISRFLEAQPPREIPAFGTNTSFRGGPRTRLTPTEEWLCTRISGPVASRYGYPSPRGELRGRDLGDLARTTLRFGLYQSRRYVRNPAARESIRTFLKRAFSLRGTGALPRGD